MWRETTQHKRNMKIFQEEFDQFLPKTILDFHAHIFSEGILPEGQPFDCAGRPIWKYDLRDLDQDLTQLYPGRETLALCFGFPDTDYNFERNNEYLAEQCDRKHYFPLRLFDPQEPPDRVRNDLTAGRFLGIKPYPDYVRKRDIHEAQIREMLPDWVMEIINDLGLIIMLHIPRKDRLADPMNQSQLVELCTTYPGARIILAHVGRAYFLKNIVGRLDHLAELHNLYYDVTMLNNWEVLEYLFQRVDPAKILYGTDIPLGLAPGKSVEINNQYTYVTPAPWKLSISDDHGKLVFTSFIYEEIRAIKKAVERLGLAGDFLDGLFYTNGMNLLNQALRAGS